MTTTTTRDAIIERIRKLSKYTQENGASENEAYKAAEAISKLIAEHNITQTELSLKEEAAQSGGLGFEIYTDLRADKTPWIDCVWDIAKLFMVQCYRSRDEERDPILGYHEVRKINFFGYKTDCIAAINLTAIIHNSILSESHRYRPYRKRESHKDEIDRLSFQTGMVHRICSRLRQMTPPPVTSNGRDLVPLKNQLVLKAWEEATKHLKLTPATSAGVRASSGAYRLGIEAGSRVSLTGRQPLGAHTSSYAPSTPRIK